MILLSSGEELVDALKTFIEASTLFLSYWHLDRIGKMLGITVTAFQNLNRICVILIIIYIGYKKIYYFLESINI